MADLKKPRKQRKERVKQTVAIQDLAAPEQELTEEQAAAVQGGEVLLDSVSKTRSEVSAWFARNSRA